MGGSHPSSSSICNAGKEWGIATFLSLGERLVSKAMLCPVQGVPVLPSVNISGGDSMGTSFLYTSIIQRTEAAYIKNTLQVCYKRFIRARCLRQHLVFCCDPMLLQSTNPQVLPVQRQAMPR